MIYYQSKELSDKLEINAAKWKRWARVFLPPDALGGFQSGYARQFTLKEAFRVYLGGLLIGSLRYDVSEAKRILNDLHSWLKEHGFYSLRVIDSGVANDQPFFRIYIYPLGRKFGYTIRGIQAERFEDEEESCERYSLSILPPATDPVGRGHIETARVLGISRVYDHFISRLTS